jgi:hypothetical protein
VYRLNQGIGQVPNPLHVLGILAATTCQGAPDEKGDVPTHVRVRLGRLESTFLDEVGLQLRQARRKTLADNVLIQTGAKFVHNQTIPTRELPASGISTNSLDIVTR